MRIAWLVASVCAVSVYAAPARGDAIRDLVAATVDTSGARDADILAKDAIVVAVRGKVSASLKGRFDGPQYGPIGDHAFVFDAVKVTEDPRGFAWFTGRIDVALSRDGKVYGHESVRVTGIAVKSPTWKLAAIMYANPMADDLATDIAIDAHVRPAKGAPTLHGDPVLAKQAASWFPTLSRDRSTTSDLWVGGSAPKELATGNAAASKVVAGWDKLQLGATDIDARTFANGAVGWVTASVRLRIPGKDAAIELALGAIVVKDSSGAFKWVALNVTPTRERQATTRARSDRRGDSQYCGGRSSLRVLRFSNRV